MAKAAKKAGKEALVVASKVKAYVKSKKMIGGYASELQGSLRDWGKQQDCT